MSHGLKEFNYNSPYIYGWALWNTKSPGIDQFGWYDVDYYRNIDGGYFIGNDYLPSEF